VPHEEDLSILDVNSEEDEDIEAANKVFPTSNNCIAKKAISLENNFITKMDAFW